MGTLRLTYYEREGALEKSALFVLGGLEKKSASKEKFFSTYRYGFNGQEKDDEVSGNGNSYTAEFWQYDSRLGRRWNVDPVVKPHESSYAAFANSPIWLVDPTGADTSFASNADKQHVNNMLDKTSADYSKKFAKKMKRLIKSDKMYKFESIQPGGKHKDGQVYADNKDKNLIHVKFTTGNSKMNSYSVYGYSKHKVLFEETFHAWEYDKGGLDLMNPNIYNEARAWKFSSHAPGTNFTTMKNINGTKQKVYTVMYQMHNFSLGQIASMLKNGSYTQFNQTSQRWYAGSEAVDKNGNFYKPMRGLYYNLPWK